MISRSSRWYLDGKDHTCISIYLYIYISCFLSGFSNYWNFRWFTYERLLFPCFFLYVYKRVNFQSTVIYIYYFNSWFITWIFMMFQWFFHRLFMRNTTHNCSSLGCCQSLGVLFNTPRPVAGKFLLGCKPRTSYSHAGVYRILKKTYH